MGHCYKNFEPLGEMGNKESFGGVLEKKGKVRVRGKVILAVSRKRSVVEQNGRDPRGGKGYGGINWGSSREKG